MRPGAVGGSPIGCDAEHLKAAFNIVSIRDLGTNKYFLWAQALTRLAD